MENKMTEDKELKNKAPKAKKPPKKFPAKKLPGLLKKSYTQKKFNSKILKKIYIPEDKKLIESLFSEKYTKGKKELIRVPRENQFTKKELSQLKKISKSIKKNKGRVKLVPFIAVAGRKNGNPLCNAGNFRCKM